MRTDKENTDDLRKEYDFRSLEGGVRGKHFKRASAGTNLVLTKQSKNMRAGPDMQFCMMNPVAEISGSPTNVD